MHFTLAQILFLSALALRHVRADDAYVRNPLCKHYDHLCNFKEEAELTNMHSLG